MRPTVLIALGLLAAVALAALFFAREMRRDRPVDLRVPMATVPVGKPALAIVVKGQGALEVNGAAMDLAALERLLRERQWDEGAAVTVRAAAEGVAFTETVSVLDLCRRCGVVRLFVDTSQIEEPNGSASPGR